GPGEVGVRAGRLVDRAFGDGESGDALVLAETADIPVGGPVGELDALAAACLARAVSVPAAAIADALATFRVGRHRAEVVAVADGITYVDDSKATNPHAAQASISGYPSVVWVAGGLLKGASVDGLVSAIAGRLVGVVLIGEDRIVMGKALSRHAPDVPVVELVTGEDSDMLEKADSSESDVTYVTQAVDVGERSVADAVMNAVVDAARSLARPGDTVLLAPAGASFDQFSGYAHRGDAFAAAVRAVVG
ncbi:MAG: UDP-N-acetylmuramoyl-L-alanine--D-glutamate ligase, partial [Actinomycetia bacterium]|nr:UDP-N-acetylmuramoyl-L-alanine--D-glutamate ligase [Actinomycetes bacterium]